MEELRIRAYGLELKVSGEANTVKGASKDFYDFLAARIGRDTEAIRRLREKMMSGQEEAKKPTEGKEATCTFRSAAGVPAAWSEIAKEIKSGKEYHVGDAVDDVLENGEEVTFVVTEVTDQYVRFESRDCVGSEGVSWNKNDSNKGGIAEANVQKYLDTKIWELLPEDLRAAISDTSRKYLDGGEEKEYVTKLFLPAASEVFDEDDCYGDEGLYEQLEYYKDRRNRMRSAAQEEDVVWYWLASVRSGISADACGVSRYGFANTWSTSYLNRVPVCFTIKKS